jgi:hypothetical protein
LLVPTAAGARACGEAIRTIAAADAQAAKPHGCAGCSKARRSKLRPVIARAERFQAIVPVGGDVHLAMFCCHDAAPPQRAGVDVPTLGGSVHAGPTLLVIAIDGWLAAATLRAAPARTEFKIGPSPPYLAALHRHTYLCTSTLLI